MGVFLKTSISIIFLLFAETVWVYGQATLSKLEIGASVSSYHYLGDLTPTTKGSFKNPELGLMIFASRPISQHFALRTNLAFGSLKGDDGKFPDPSWRKQRNFSFKSPLFEISELLVWNVLNQDNSFPLRPYLFGGIGIAVLDIRRDLSLYNAEFFANEPHVQAGLNADLAKPLPKSIPVFPLGIGINYSLNSKFTLFGESSFRLTKTDYLDGFSQAANPSRKDQYWSNSIGVFYKFARRNAMDWPPDFK